MESKKRKYDENTNTSRKKIKYLYVESKKRKYDENTNTSRKKMKFQNTFDYMDFNIVQDIILSLEYGTASRILLQECKDRYTYFIKNYQITCELIQLLNQFVETTIRDEMELYRQIYKIENLILKKK